LLKELRKAARYEMGIFTRLFSPAGLNIGGDKSEAIALSIAAEIQVVLKRELGGSLRDEEGSIHDQFIAEAVSF